MLDSSRVERLKSYLKKSGSRELIVPLCSEKLFIENGLGDEGDFNNFANLENIAAEYFDALEEVGLERLIFGAIDDYYFNWIKRRNWKDSEKSRINYIKSLPEDAKEISLLNNGYGYESDYAILPFIFYNRNYYPDQILSKDTIYNLTLSEDEISRLKEIIIDGFNSIESTKNKYNITKEDIAISPYFISFDDYKNDDVTDDMLDLAKFIFDGESFEFKKYKRQVVPADKPFELFGVFVTFVYDVPATFDIDYLMTGLNIPDLEMNGLESIFGRINEAEYFPLLPGLIYIEEIDSVRMDFEVGVEEEIKMRNTYSAKTMELSGHLKSDKKATKKKKKK